MKEVFNKDVRNIQLEILENVHAFCIKNNINYTLTYGTLLGAVRHKGYIPWDDDIDIAMPFPDYVKFLKLYNSNNTSYKVIDVDIDKKFPYIMGKVEKIGTLIKEPGINYKFGINIDIFPLYGMPENETDQLKHFKRIKKIHRFLIIKNIKFRKVRRWYKNLALLCIKTLLLPFSFNYLSYRKLIKKYSYQQMNNVKLTSFEMKKLSVFPKQYFEERVLVDFEKKSYFIPKEYDKILTNIYGNYMVLPPQNEQKTHHLYNAYINNID